MEMPFGKYKGIDLRDIPLGYLRWVEESLNLHKELRDEINFEIERRIGDRPNAGKVIKSPK